MARGLPVEGERAGEKRAIAFATQGVVACAPTDTIAAVRAAVAESPFGFALVVSSNGTVLGRLRKAILEREQDAVAESVMELGPSTNRPNISTSKLWAKLQAADLKTAILTDPEGRLIGVVRRDDLPEANGH